MKLSRMRHQRKLTGENVNFMQPVPPVIHLNKFRITILPIGGNSIGLYSNKKVLERKEVIVRVSIFIVPKVSNIKIDKLSITVPILSKAEHEHIVKCFEYNGKLSNWGEIGKSKKYNTHYAHPVVGENTEITMYLQYPQYYLVTNTLKIEFNPSKVNMEQVRMLINQIMKNGFERLIEYGRITRIDLACDIARIRPHHIFFYAPYFSITDCKYKSGNLQTAYLGDSESDNQWVIYDKVAEIKDKNHKKEFKMEVPVERHGNFPVCEVLAPS